MTRSITKLTVLIITLLLAWHSSAHDTQDEWQVYTEVITESYDFTTDEPVITLTNRYGNIELTTSETSTAKVEITIKVEAKSKNRADQIFNRIDIDLSGGGSRLTAETSIQNQNNNWTKKSENFRINYKIHVPRQSKVRVENKYGDIALADVDNDLRVELKYGNGQIQNVGGELLLDLGYVKSFSAGDVTGNLTINAKHSTLSIGDAQEVDMTSKYSIYQMGNMTDMTIEAKYDRFDIQSAGRITSEGKYNKFQIEKAEGFVIDTKYTHVTIGTLHNQGDFDTQHGSVEIKHLAAEFDRFKIDSEHTRYDIRPDGGYQLTVDAEYTKVDYPSGLDVSVRDRDRNEIYLEGSHPGTGNGRIIAEMRHGRLEL
ncbi:MAG: hypothetical protein AAFR14_11390 [Bacteroidota bacterium]